ncbi:MAG: hypothetical protein WBQ89_16490 [Candidatus Acidiferrum sp.]
MEESGIAPDSGSRCKASSGVTNISDWTATQLQGVTHAYSLDEIKKILSVVPEPARTVVLTAAFTGLRQGELRGLLWKDFNGKELNVQRSIWNGVVNKPKTVCSASPIPVVLQLRDALEAHRQRMGTLAAADHPIFQSGIGTPMNLADVAKRIITPKIEKCVKCRKPSTSRNRTYSNWTSHSTGRVGTHSDADSPQPCTIWELPTKKSRES